MQKLEINLLEITEEEFQQKRREYIRDCISDLGWKKSKAEASFDADYPNKEVYKSKTTTLNGFGEQQVINKINEIIDFINKIPDSNIQTLKEILQDVE